MVKLARLRRAGNGVVTVNNKNIFAEMVKLADTLVLEASTARCGGSSPPLGTKHRYTEGILIIIIDPFPTSLLNSIVPPC